MVVSLPVELIEQVIVRVQCIKSILRCTSVCKSWYVLINSPQFTNIHLSHPNNNKYLLCYYDEARGPFYSTKQRYYSIDFDNESLHEHCKLLALHGLHVQRGNGCNGLICYKMDCHLYLWNPAIRKLKIIPKSPNSSNHRGPDAFKLWFDTKSNDYKISTITYARKAFIVELYSLSTNSWKLISDNAPGKPPLRLVFVNGILHWPVHRNGKWILISLVAENGMFKEILIPWEVKTVFLEPFGDQSLCVLGYKDGNNSDFCCHFLQVSDKSLDKLYIFDFQDSKIVNLMPLGFRNNGELLFRNINDERRIVSFNLETTEMKDFVQRTSCKLRWVIPFVETLALLNDEDAMYEPNLFPNN